MKRMTKDDILKALETISAPGEGQNLVESKAITNIQIFGDEVEVDVTINNPSLQAKKKLEVSVLQAIHKEVYEKAKIKVNLKVEAPAQSRRDSFKFDQRETNSGYKEHYSRSLWKRRGRKVYRYGEPRGLFG